jgi:hypothetical protein
MAAAPARKTHMNDRYTLLLLIPAMIASWRVVDAMSRATKPEPGFKPWTAKLCAAVEIAAVLGSAAFVLATFR